MAQTVIALYLALWHKQEATLTSVSLFFSSKDPPVTEPWSCAQRNGVQIQKCKESEQAGLAKRLPDPCQESRFFLLRLLPKHKNNVPWVFGPSCFIFSSKWNLTIIIFMHVSVRLHAHTCVTVYT